MKTPPEHPFLVAMGEAWARKVGWSTRRFLAILHGEAVPTDTERAMLVGAGFPRVRPDHFRLTASETGSTLHTMHTSPIAEPRTGRPSKLAKHPLMVALAKAGVTVAEEAKAIHRSVASLRSFCFSAKSEHYRPVPRAIADRWLAEYKVPLATWPRIAD